MPTKKLAKVPKPWAVIHRKSLGTLVRAETRTLEDLRRVVRLVTAELSDAVANVPNAHLVEEATRLLRRFAQHLQDRFRDALLDAKKAAREDALERFDEELKQIRHELTRREVRQLPDMNADISGRDEDNVESEAAAASFRASWAATVLAIILRFDPEEKDKDLSLQILQASRSSDKKIRRIATTETSRAYNRQHADVVEDFEEQHKETDWLPLVFRRWDATLDQKVCQVCRDHDGEIVPLGFDFSEGEAPGDVHPNCRCSDTILLIPVPIQEEDKEAA